MARDVGTASFGTTGNKTIIFNLGGATPTWARATMGARANTTETNILWSYGVTTGTSTVHCRAVAPGKSKKWPYTAESNYFIVGYDTSGTKVFSATLQATPFTTDELNINVDVANSNYQVLFELGT